MHDLQFAQEAGPSSPSYEIQNNEAEMYEFDFYNTESPNYYNDADQRNVAMDAEQQEQYDSSGSDAPSPEVPKRERANRPRRSAAGGSSSGSPGPAAGPGRRRRCGGISARERNLRRLESNERERMRMHSLNRAFEDLRRVIPHVRKDNRSLSKIETLTLARNYVKALTNLIWVMRGESPRYNYTQDDEYVEPARVLADDSQYSGEQNNNEVEDEGQEVEA
ncbi:class A basic helix-loop-helix protein 15-like [Pectinophora gossypiella]|uniref:class A basic helix-loop-helix protein 15-like n=1 Tax=Pectinophora gossypiella TaxID=13191 RepID=UPI00214E4F76|nr:class A basic helix-loop-helix protein 15-like [Pectinophora gossypiella]